MPRDYYETLGVSKKASLEEIKKAYRESALRFHPDRVPEAEKKAAEEKFKEISEAYAILSDPQKRALYDQRGHAGISQNYAYEDIMREADFGSIFQDLSDYGVGEDLFEQLFGNLGAARFGRGSQGRRRSYDLQVTVDISLKEAAQGTEKTFTLPLKPPQHLTITIPKGVDTGSQLRLKGKGEEGRGDLYVLIEVRPHPLFERQGSNLYTELAVPLSTAVLGGEVKVPTLFGSASMKIPQGTQSGQLFRLQGKGMPNLKGSRLGDEFVRIKIQIPTSLTSEQRKLMEAFAKAHGDN